MWEILQALVFQQSPQMRAISMCRLEKYRPSPLLGLQVQFSSADGECDGWQVCHGSAAAHHLPVAALPVQLHAGDRLQLQQGSSSSARIPDTGEGCQQGADGMHPALSHRVSVSQSKTCWSGSTGTFRGRIRLLRCWAPGNGCMSATLLCWTPDYLMGVTGCMEARTEWMAWLSSGPRRIALVPLSMTTEVACTATGLPLIPTLSKPTVQYL